MTLRTDLDDLFIWGQIGKAWISGEWVEGTAIFRDRWNSLVYFLGFGQLENSNGFEDLEDLLHPIAWSDFEVDDSFSPIRPACAA